MHPPASILSQPVWRVVPGQSEDDQPDGEHSGRAPDEPRRVGVIHQQGRQHLEQDELPTVWDRQSPVDLPQGDEQRNRKKPVKAAMRPENT